MVGSMTYAQSLLSPREIGMGAYTASSKDSREFTANPAGITRIKDWDFSTTTYTPVNAAAGGFVFDGLSFGKRFLDREAIAFQYSPGSLIRFVTPATVTISGSSTPTSSDQTIEYSEIFSVAFAHRLLDNFSVGVSGRFRREKLTDTQYQLVVRDTISFPTAFQQEFDASSLDIDLGLHWSPVDRVSIGIVGRNLVTLRVGELPSTNADLRLPLTRALELGGEVAVTPNFRVAASASTQKTAALGCEWSPGFGLSFRAGLYGDHREQPFVSAAGLSLGWAYEFLEIDAGYLFFLNQRNRTGTATSNGFSADVLTNINFNKYTRDRLSFSAKAIFGNIRESLARIESVEMLGAVYPSAYEVLAYRPIGKVRVRNISPKPIQTRASFYVDKLMDAPTETPSVYIPSGEVAEIPLTAVFNDRVRSVPKMMIREGNVSVSATIAEEPDDRYQTRVLIHGRNDWDGDVKTLRYFVTPEDPEIIRYGRDVLLQHIDSLAHVAHELEQFKKARILFNTFAGKLVYVSDPKQSADFVQYPSETLRLRGGDCDDMTVLFSSLLNSIGISTAFVDVIPPGRPEDGHVYLLFDTGLDPKFGSHIADNPKRYVIRKSRSGVETIWIPVETTVTMRGFDDAWTNGAQEYFDDVEVGLGLVKGWVHLVDVY